MKKKRMKRRVWMSFCLVFILLLGVGCVQSKTDKSTQSDNRQEVQQNEQQTSSSQPSDQSKPDQKDTKRNLSKVYGIFYGSEQDQADILLFDSVFNGDPIFLSDEARVFFSDKGMNTLVELDVEDRDGKIFVKEAKTVQKASLEVKYIGFSDNNYAEFQLGEKGIVVEVSEHLIDRLMKVSTHELLSIVIEQSETEQANPILVDFK